MTNTSNNEYHPDYVSPPGIVVGRLQHEQLLPYDHCNDLKRFLDWKDIIIEEQEERTTRI